ncbi:class I SAM-dependent methyltransferase [Reinekea blandensis]|uniref:Uncharacterized protein n=1 Tax=Reinekea blandensis MED297 TaxID=314283 RepID=A4BKE8_9GAMM|nr:class I SAM-dependent methyltransferase [Reinekea blandensis]EAR07395.1 hypothetical protein MED297_03442 [Reinekea sp. MED297] [Reinekea blandensis MED297]
MDNKTYFSEALGFVSREPEWVPSIRYLLRRNRIQKIAIEHESKLLEIGCGAGTLLQELALMGPECTGIEKSGSALCVANQINKNLYSKIQLHASISDVEDTRFDYVFAFDVLEHIENDTQALTEWNQLLNKTGKLIISVPCHTKKFSYGDIWAGHFRRYNKADIKQVLAESGFEISYIESYGFPLAVLTEKVGNLYYKIQLKKKEKIKSIKNHTDESGIDRKAYAKYFKLMNHTTFHLIMKLFYVLQSLFKSKDIGSGYLIIAVKSS